jgi:hypothetical protein
MQRSHYIEKNSATTTAIKAPIAEINNSLLLITLHYIFKKTIINPLFTHLRSKN